MYSFSGDSKIQKEMMSLLGLISFPFSEKDLKAKYYQKALENHPDVGGSEETMQKINEAKEYLMIFCQEDSDLKSTTKRIITNLDPFSIYDECPNCYGLGLVTHDINEYVRCPNLCETIDKIFPSINSVSDLYRMWDSKFFATRYAFERAKFSFIYRFSFQSFYGHFTFHRVDCKACSGSGNYTNLSGRTVRCNRCQGRGWVIDVCNRCFGLGEMQTSTKHERRLCLYCNGTGKVKRIQENPVILSGAILIGEKLS